MSIPEISIVVPVYNSAIIIDELHSSVSKALSGFCTFELILVNDGSKDDSWTKIKTLAEKNKNITGLNLRKNSGQDNALLAGMRISIGNYVVVMDDDLQHSPNDIIALYTECKKGSDVCFANFETKKQSVFKNMGSYVNGKTAEVLLQKPKGIYLSPFKIITRDVVNEIAKFAGPFPYIDGILLTITKNFSQVNLQHQARSEGKGNYTFSKSFSVFMKLFTGFSIAPLRIATITGVVATVVSFCLLIKYLIDYFINKNFIEGWTTVVVLIIFFGGLILITLGIIGEYLGRIYLTLNNKPQYTIAEIVTGKDEK